MFIGYRWNGSTWTLLHVPSVSSVSCTSSRFCMAVGLAQGPLSPHEVVVRWNGSKWLLGHGAGGPNSSLDSVTCTSAHWCLATGTDANGSDNQIWNGKSWSYVTFPPVGLLSCVAARVCTGIESDYSPNISEQPFYFSRHYADGSWSKRKELPGGDSITPSGIACSMPRACTLVGAIDGNPLAERWDGVGWTIQRVPIPAVPSQAFQTSWLEGVSCPSVTDCIAVGFNAFDSSPSVGTSETLVEQYH